MMTKKGQGTIEYLVIIAIVIVIALVVVGLLLQLMGNSSGVSDSSNKAAWKSGTPWSVDWSRNTTAWTLSLKNVSADTLSINKVVLGSGDQNTAVGISSIAPGASTIVIFTGSACTAGSRYSLPKSYPAYIDYNTGTISGMRQYATADMTGTC